MKTQSETQSNSETSQKIIPETETFNCIGVGSIWNGDKILTQFLEVDTSSVKNTFNVWDDCLELTSCHEFDISGVGTIPEVWDDYTDLPDSY